MCVAGALNPHDRPRLKRGERESPLVLGPGAFSVLYSDKFLVVDEEKEHRRPEIVSVEENQFAVPDPAGIDFQGIGGAYFTGGPSYRLSRSRIRYKRTYRGFPYYRQGVGRYFGPEERYEEEKDWAWRKFESRSRRGQG